MPRKALGDRPLTTAERQDRWRSRNASRSTATRLTLEQILEAKTLREARQLAAEALGYWYSHNIVT